MANSCASFYGHMHHGRDSMRVCFSMTCIGVVCVCIFAHCTGRHEKAT